MVVCVYFSLCCKNASVPQRSRNINPCVCVCVCMSAHTHILFLSADATVSVGPVWGAAVARLVDLALLLQAAGLTTLARPALRNQTSDR